MPLQHPETVFVADQEVKSMEDIVAEARPSRQKDSGHHS